MHNHQLKIFLRVADAGGFNKAAEEDYITATLERTHSGLIVTKAGKFLYYSNCMKFRKFIETEGIA